MYNGYFGFLELPLALPRPAFFLPQSSTPGGLRQPPPRHRRQV